MRLSINILTILVRLLDSVCLLLIHAIRILVMPSMHILTRITSRCTTLGFKRLLFKISK